MLGKIGDHRPDDTKIVRAAADVWKEIAHFQPALPVALEIPEAAERRAVVLELGRLRFQTKRPAILFLQAGFGIKTVHLRHSAVHIEEDDVAGLGHKMRRERNAWARSGSGAVGSVGQERGQGDGAETQRAFAQQLAAGHDFSGGKH